MIARIPHRSAVSDMESPELFEILPDAIVVSDRRGRIVHVNRQAETMFGYGRDELIGAAVEILVPGRFRERHLAHRASYYPAARTRPMSTVLDMYGRRKDGSEIPLDIMLSPQETDQGLLVISVIRDVTRQKRAEEALRESEEHVRTIVTNAPVALWSLDRNGVYTLSVGKGLEPLGVKPGEHVGLSAFDIYRDFPEALELHRRGLSGEAFNATVEVSGVTFECWYTPILDQSGEVTSAVGVAMDVTERKRLQEQLIQADKLAALGTPVSGIAHDVSNPISSALERGELLIRVAEIDDTLIGDLQMICGEMRRAINSMQNLLSFAQGHGAEKSYISINDILENTLELRSYDLVVSSLEVTKDLQPDLPRTMADPSQLQQVFSNLIRNAEQAMSEAHGRGALAVRAHSVGDAIHVAITDDGPGIPRENLSRIFDPFFTTKAEGRGIGLGLGISYRIVQEHGGAIRVASEVGRGATFTVELPSSLKIPPAGNVRPGPSSPPGQGWRRGLTSRSLGRRYFAGLAVGLESPSAFTPASVASYNSFEARNSMGDLQSQVTRG